MYKTISYSKSKKRPLTRSEYESYHEYNTYTNENDRD